jgi:hypothetical protein
MVFVKATDDSEKGVFPTAKAFAAMDRFNNWGNHDSMHFRHVRVAARSAGKCILSRVSTALPEQPACDLREPLQREANKCPNDERLADNPPVESGLHDGNRDSYQYC